MVGNVPVIPLNEQENDSNPLMKAGYGVNSFFDIMKRLMIMLLGITIVMFPVMVMYKNDNEQGVFGLDKISYKTQLNAISLGNLGGAQT